MGRIKYSLNTNALKKQMDPEDIVGLAMDLHLDGVEWGIRLIKDYGI